jgi:FkbM family methyltransferase
MPGQRFFGIKKSTIKKTPPFKFLFDWRDRKLNQNVFAMVEQGFTIDTVSPTEKAIHYPMNEKEITIIYREFPFSDLMVFDQVFLRNCYLPIVEKMKEHIDSSLPLKIIDAGANVGYSCLYFKACFPQSELVAIEPEESNGAQLEKNLAANNFQIRKLVKGALWHRPAFLEVVRDFRDNREAAFTVREVERATEIQGFSFDQILKQQNWQEIDLFKIDIEGSERFLFDTEENADAILQKSKFLAIEIHDEFQIRSTIYGHLKRNGFSYFEFDDLTLAINHKKVNY